MEAASSQNQPKRKTTVDIADITARDIMTHKVLTASPFSTLEEIVTIMSSKDIRHLPVVEHGKVVGMISDRDVREMLPSHREIMQDPELARSRFDRAIQGLFPTDFVSIEESASLSEVIDVLVSERVGALPVVDEKENKLVGIISYIDVLNSVARQL